MKISLKVILALALIVIASYWAVDSVSQHSYAGSNLNFAIGSGSVTVTNPSDEAVPVQLTSPETRPFVVASALDGAAGTSAREGTGRAAVQLLTFDLPSGVTEFSITRGTNVTFAATGDSDIEATVQPMSANDARNTLIGVGLVILATLYYISRTTGHGWTSAFRRQAASDLIAKKSAERAAFKRILERTNPH